MPLARNIVPIRPRPVMDNPSTRPDTAPSTAAVDPLADVIARIAVQRDRAAFHRLYEQFSPKIKAFAIKQGMYENADELVQEVMINIWRRAAQFDPAKASGATWIFAIARNARIDHLRKQGRLSAEVNVETEVLWELPGGSEPAGQVDESVMVQRVRASLDTLPIEQRDVIAKVYLEDKSHQRVAEELNLPLGTVKSRVRLALQKLNVLLQEQIL